MLHEVLSVLVSGEGGLQIQDAISDVATKSQVLVNMGTIPGVFFFLDIAVQDHCGYVDSNILSHTDGPSPLPPFQCLLGSIVIVNVR